jgi:extracellular factor (EF) 3-hydroxypalmitic acid methyl ester biosynthesis protein
LEVERQAAQEIGASVVPAFTAMHERLESLSEGIEADLRPAHQNFASRQLHALMMCSPFAYRTYHKPLGYAGDYEMVNMIVRDPYEGASLYAKVVNLWFLSQWPARAHRNRIQYLKELLTQEALRGAREGRVIRVLNLGCGPAQEVQEFIASNSLCEQTQFTLLDFNEETIRHTTGVLEECKRRYGRRTSLQIQKQSVQRILKERSKLVVEGPEKKYDLIYCAGLFDYLPDRTCRQLMNVFYDWLAPGGLVAATNVDDCKPFRHMLEFVLDWHLIYRSERKGLALAPDRVSPEAVSLRRDPTAVNLFIEVRKDGHG